MEQLGILKRIPRYSPERGQVNNQYDLSGLVEKLKAIASEEIEIRKSRKAQDGIRRRHKRPAAGKAK
jgi:hypothetical protein